MGAIAPPNMDPREAAAVLVDDHESDPAWLDAFAEAFDRRRAGRQLERILRVWDLSQSEAGRLFGVSRQAVAKWLRGGAGADRAEQVADLSAATDLLVHHVKRDRIRAVVRREAAVLGGRSLIDLFADGESRRLLETVQNMFAFGEAHG